MGKQQSVMTRAGRFGWGLAKALVWGTGFAVALVLLRRIADIEGCSVPVALYDPDRQAPPCIEFWLNRYQSLIAALIAVVTASLAIYYARRQIGATHDLALRQEREARSEFDRTLRARLGIMAEAWRYLDWALTPDAPDAEKRASMANAAYWHSEEERRHLAVLDELAMHLGIGQRYKALTVCVQLHELVDFLDERKDDVSPRKAELLRIRFAFVVQAVEHYDLSLAAVFDGCQDPRLNPGNSAQRMRTIREASIQKYETETIRSAKP